MNLYDAKGNKIKSKFVSMFDSLFDSLSNDFAKSLYGSTPFINLMSLYDHRGKLIHSENAIPIKFDGLNAWIETDE